MSKLESAAGSVLVFADAQDLNFAAAAWALKRNGIRAIGATSISTLDPKGMSVYFSERGEPFASWSSSAHQFRAVWYRRIQDSKPPLPCDPRDAEFVDGEWRDMQRALLRIPDSFVRSFWVNDPTAAIRAENKLLQLKLAREIGLTIPETLVSNNVEHVREFISNGAPVVMKTFSPFLWTVNEDEGALGTSVTILRDADEISDSSISLCPSIYQRLVDKVCDIRVTIIGNKLFPAQFTSREGGALLDWRPSTFMPELITEPCNLPSGIEQKLLALQSRLGIVFGCVDLAIDRAGSCYFFEVNQGGQFLFLEQLEPRLPLLRAFCAMLAQGRVDYSMSSTADLSYAAFKRTTEFALIAETKRTRSLELIAELDLH